MNRLTINLLSLLTAGNALGATVKPGSDVLMLTSTGERQEIKKGEVVTLPPEGAQFQAPGRVSVYVLPASKTDALELNLLPQGEH